MNEIPKYCTQNLDRECEEESCFLKQLSEKRMCVPELNMDEFSSSGSTKKK